MIGFHFQSSVDGWPNAVAKLPPSCWVKAVDNVQLLNEAKAVNPNINTVLRHWYDFGQQFDGGIEGNKTRARGFFASFIDGTFDNYAHNVDAIEGFNEYLANSQNATEVQARIDWVTAAAQVWQNEYRNQAKYSHIRLVLANTAIGNDIPIEFAAVAVNYDCIMGYHPYVPTKSNAPLPGEWPNYSGRWTEMDKRFRAAGYTVQWLFTEGGPVRYDQDKGNGFTNALDPQGGWRMAGVCDANANTYVSIMRYWAEKVEDWNKANGYRALGITLFTSGGGSAWKWFETKQPEMDLLANLATEFAPQEPTEPPIEPPAPPTGPSIGETMKITRNMEMGKLTEANKIVTFKFRRYDKTLGRFVTTQDKIELPLLDVTTNIAIDITGDLDKPAFGIDVSKWQGSDLPWQDFAQQGVNFTFLRVSSGDGVSSGSGNDPTYAANFANAGVAGILRGGYHYLYPDNPTGQARMFAAAFNAASELPPVLDVEQDGLTIGIIDSFIATFESLLDRQLMIYTSWDAWKTLADNADRTKYPLWVAHWTEADEPLLPVPWQSWVFWQYTSDGSLQGYNDRLDFDRFNGSYNDLLTWIAK